MTMVHSAEDAIREFNVALLQQLPLDDRTFFGMMEKDKLFPLATGNQIQARLTREDKVSYFIQHVLKPGAKQYLPTLLKVMKDSEISNVVELADDIQTYIKPGLSTIILSYKYIHNILYIYAKIASYIYMCVCTHVYVKNSLKYVG